MLYEPSEANAAFFLKREARGGEKQIIFLLPLCRASHSRELFDEIKRKYFINKGTELDHIPFKIYLFGVPKKLAGRAHLLPIYNIYQRLIIRQCVRCNLPAPS